jgi:hypothetical protein
MGFTSPPEGDHAVDFCSRLGLAPMASLITITPLRMTYIYVTGAFYHSKDLANQLSPWSRVLLEKPKKKEFILAKNSLLSMALKGSLLCSQDPATGPYPGSDESNPYPPTLSP